MVNELKIKGTAVCSVTYILAIYVYGTQNKNGFFYFHIVYKNKQFAIKVNFVVFFLFVYIN